jgi:hypothetical protein
MEKQLRDVKQQLGAAAQAVEATIVIAALAAASGEAK